MPAVSPIYENQITDHDVIAVDAGFGRGDKPFSAHLTIGRIKYPQGLEKLMTRLPEEKFESAEFPVSEVVIFKSDLSPRGPTYTALGRVRLGGE